MIKSTSRTAALLFAYLFCIGACSHQDKARDSADAFSIRINRAPADSAASRWEAAPQSRELGFQVTGAAARQTSVPDIENKAAATQAAILDALTRAIIEARRTRGQTTSDFTVKIGPRLTFSHRAFGDGYESQITLIARGVDTTFIVRNGLLQHPPHDLKTLRQVFDETHGEYELLGANWDPTGGVYQARVAWYRPAGLDAALAGEARQESVQTP